MSVYRDRVRCCKGSLYEEGAGSGGKRGNEAIFRNEKIDKRHELRRTEKDRPTKIILTDLEVSENI